MILSPRRWLLIAGSFLALFSIVGFFVIPPVARSQLEKRASAALGRRVTVEKLRLNPFALSVTLEKLDVRSADGTRSFLGWDRLYVDCGGLSSLFGEWVLSAIELEGFHAEVARLPDGSFDFADILAKLTPSLDAPKKDAATEKPSRPLRIGRLSLTGATLSFTDLSGKTPFKTVLGPTSFELSDFSTTVSPGAPARFETTTESGEKVSWKGTLGIAPLASSGEFNVEALLLSKYAPYYSGLAPISVLDGRLSLKGRYEAGLGPDKQFLLLRNGSVQLRALRMAEAGGETPVLELPSLDVTGIEADALALKATVKRVAIQGGSLSAQRLADGSLNLLRLLPQNPTVAATPDATVAAAPAAPAKTPKPLDLLLGEFALDGFAVSVEDLAAPGTAHLGLSELHVSIKNLTLADKAPMPFDASFAWSPAGRVSVEGTALLKPEVQISLKSKVEAMEILPLSPYLEQFINARITQGRVSSALEASLALPQGKAPVATANGTLSVDAFALVDSLRSEPLAGFGGLTLSGFKAGNSPSLALSIEEITLSAPFARAVIDKDKTFNLASLAKAPPTATAQPVPPAVPAAVPAAAPAPSALPHIEIARIVIEGGDFSFTDHSQQPRVQVALTEFGGTLTHLSTANPGKGEIALKSLVDGAGMITLKGRLDPLAAKKFVAMKIDVKSVDLVPLSPYSGRFAGYELARGKLSVDITAKLDDHALDLANLITLNQLNFGAASGNAEATNLPVRLGVALLKDMDGKIVLDVPVQGSLEDPDFRVSKVVWRVVSNILVKAAASPFSLLGSMFGGGGDELAFQTFAPGSSELQSAELPKLETLLKALNNRPALSLAISGFYEAAADGYALKRLKLAEQVRRKIWEEQRATHPNIAAPEKLPLTPEQSAGMIRKLFDTQFPPKTIAAAAPLPPPPPPASALASAPAKPKYAFVRRVLNLATLRVFRGKKAAPSPMTAATPSTQPAPSAPVAVPQPEQPALSLEEMTARLADAITITEDDLHALANERARRVRNHLATAGKIAEDRLFLGKAKATPATQPPTSPRVTMELQ
jgi:hypothetical protein